MVVPRFLAAGLQRGPGLSRRVCAGRTAAEKKGRSRGAKKILPLIVITKTENSPVLVESFLAARPQRKCLFASYVWERTHHHYIARTVIRAARRSSASRRQRRDGGQALRAQIGAHLLRRLRRGRKLR